MKLTVYPHNNNTTFSLYDLNVSYKFVSSFIVSKFSIINSILCFAINLACLYAYKKFKIVDTAQTKFKQKMENRLTIYSVLTFFSQLFYSIYMIIFYIAAFQLQNYGVDSDLSELIFLSIYNNYSWVIDISIITFPSFLLFWACENIRINVYKIIKFICFYSTKNTVMVISKQKQILLLKQQQ
ncbi:Serpentine receptor class gamma [Meloidogyne graminicola]|uniref:Serpentine receptor class gamma n=1 Tax=Meloidogyne graminicola TaxID=189291 RepID=A0A8T0A2P0_9BILA|nr:Serpentine receptor class gamma [Meloidogyne graminicola]